METWSSSPPGFTNSKTGLAFTPEHGDLADFVGDTIDTFYQYFGQIGRIEIQRAEKALQAEGSSIPHPMMDSRISEDFPHEWLTYQSFDQSLTPIIVHQMAIHAHLGRDMKNVSRNILTAKDELDGMERSHNSRPEDYTVELHVDVRSHSEVWSFVCRGKASCQDLEVSNG